MIDAARLASRRSGPSRPLDILGDSGTKPVHGGPRGLEAGGSMGTGKLWVAALGMVVALAGAARAQTVEIEYWQYTFPQRVQAIDELIKRFEAANPGIRVKHTHVPYDDFRLKIAAAIPAGQGPDVVQLFYGWLQDYLKAQLLQPLPTELFDPAEIERDFYPLVRQMKVDGRY